MAASTFGAAVFGAGWVSTEHIAAFKQNPHCEVVAVGSRRLQSAERAAAECGVACKVTTSFDELLADPAVHIISITTPNDSHADLGIRALEAGKHVVMEKPMAVTQEDLDKLVSIAKRSPGKTIVSFVLRWNPLFNIIHAQLADGAIGSIFYAEVDYFHAIGPWYGQFAWNTKRSVGGSALLSAGCHAVDAMLYFVGDDVVEVSAYSAKSAQDAFAPYEYDPTSVTICKFRQGAVGKITTSLEANCPYMFNILLMGDKGTIKNNQYYGEKCLGTFGHAEIGQGQTGWVTWPTILPDSGDVKHHPFFGEIDHLVDCILSDTEPMLSIPRAKHTHDICFASDVSARTGKPVRIE